MCRRACLRLSMKDNHAFKVKFHLRSAKTIITHLCVSLKGLSGLQTLVGVLTVSVSNVFLIKDCMFDVSTWKLSTWNHRALWVQEIILFSVDDLKKSKPPTTSYINACLNQSTTSPPGCLLNMFASPFVTSAPRPLTYRTTQCEYQGRSQGRRFSGGEVRE